MHDIGERTDRLLRFNRPSDARLLQLSKLAKEYFEALAKAFKAVSDVRTAADPSSITMKNRNSSGGHLLFWSIGIDNFTKTVTTYASQANLDLPQAVSKLRTMPMDLSAAPYRNVIWNPIRGTIIPRGKPLARRLMFHMAGLGADQTLLADYREAAGAGAKLPAQIA